MLSWFDGLRDLSPVSVFARMLITCILGAVIGLERSAKNRTAGFRTHMLVCMGGSIAAMTGLYIYLELKLPADVSRLSGQVIAGLGFIGAGAIIVTNKMSIKGLTTAAGLWTTGIIGLAVGSGYYEGGIIGTLLVLFIQTALAKFGEKMIIHIPQYKVDLRYQKKHALDQVLRFCKDNHMAIVNLHINSTDLDGPGYEAIVEVRGKMQEGELVKQISGMEGILSAREE